MTYTFAANGTSIAAPGNCGDAADDLREGRGTVLLHVHPDRDGDQSRQRTADYTMSSTAQRHGGRASRPALTNGAATVKVAPAPQLAINLKARNTGWAGRRRQQWRPELLGRAAWPSRGTPASALPETRNPTGWFYLSVVNQGGAASNFNVSVTQAGTPISLPAPARSRPRSPRAARPATPSLHLPAHVHATQAYEMVATADATNAVIVGGQQPSVTVTTNTLQRRQEGRARTSSTPWTPSADGTNKTVGQAKAAWTGRRLHRRGHETPAGAANSYTSITQNVHRLHVSEREPTITVGAQ